MAIRFDKLNILKDEDYFEPMAISVEDKNRRRELTNLLIDAFLYFFSVYEVHSMHKSMLSKALYEQLVTDRVSDAVSKVTGIDGEMSNYIRKLSKEVVDTTFKNAEPESEDSPLEEPLPSYPLNIDNTDSNHNSNYDDGSFIKIDEEEEGDEVEEFLEKEAVSDYWLSINRAVNIAQNEANTFLNYSDFVNAKAQGYTKKTWHTMLDNKVRDTHEEIEGMTIGIDEYFQVGNSEMKFPHDWELAPDPKETINCRCAIDYTK